MIEASFAPKRVLLTGVAGFIGFHCANRLLQDGVRVLGVDSINSYYDPQLKRDRLAKLRHSQAHSPADFEFFQLDLADRTAIHDLFATQNFDAVIHLAAQPGVRYSVDHPMVYLDSNLVGMMTMLEGCRARKTPHLVCASSSSVYGSNTTLPLAEAMSTDTPLSLYAASKKANEVMAYSYSHLYGLPTTCLRLFTVYGPWGRPDMAIFKFVRAILAGDEIAVHNFGQMRRDFTFVGDVIESISRIVQRPPTESTPFRVLNVGNSQPVQLLHFIECIERALGRKAIKRLLPMQPGEVLDTWADVSALKQLCGYQPATAIETGVKAFTDWYLSYYSN